MIKYLAKIFLIVFIWIGICEHAIAQDRTVGTLSFDPSNATDGYNLVYPHFQSNVYLLDQCGRVVHQWEDSLSTPGNIAYIAGNGNLIKAKKPFELEQPTFGAGGAGGIVEMRSWNNDLIWTREWLDTIYRQHHDLALMPNGHILVNAWEYINRDQVQEAGGDSLIWNNGPVWSEVIFEIDPLIDSIVWQWRAWDHIVQDYDSTKTSFGNIKDPERINLNYFSNATGRADWLHFNSIDYNPDLDQILISTPYYDEVWIIDHSTTTEEAASNSGGNSGKGGGLLYRWGNPEAFGFGTNNDRQLFFQHDANWIDDVDPNHPYHNLISIFNNRVRDSASNVIIIDPGYDSLSRGYNRDVFGFFAPEAPSVLLNHPEPKKMFSSGLSSFQVLENDRFLICSGRNGYSFEIDSELNIYWEYKTPFKRGVAAAQGDILEVNDNITFKIRKYPVDYPGFSALQLADDPMTIETNNPSDFCAVLTPTNDLSVDTEFKIYPNPSAGDLYIDLEEDGRDVVILDGLGREIIRHSNYKNGELISLFHMKRGIYFIKIEGINVVSKLILLGN